MTIASECTDPLSTCEHSGKCIEASSSKTVTGKYIHTVTHICVREQEHNAMGLKILRILAHVTNAALKVFGSYESTIRNLKDFYTPSIDSEQQTHEALIADFTSPLNLFSPTPHIVMGLLKSIVLVLVLVISLPQAYPVSLEMYGLITMPKDSMDSNYDELLKDIYQERKFEGLLLMHQKSMADIILMPFHKSTVPKIIITSEYHSKFAYKDFYNSEILMVLLMFSSLDRRLTRGAAEVLNYMRQSRILIIAHDTFVDQTASRAFVYAKAAGNLQISGFVAKFVMLFAEFYNASLSMLYPLKVGNQTHYAIINDMVKKNMLDIPIALAGLEYASYRNVSDFYEINQVFIMVPLAQHLTIRQMYKILLNGVFFTSILTAFLIFSLSYSTIDYMQHQHLSPNRLDVLFNFDILPGVLGLTISPSSHPKLYLKLLYVLVGYFGLCFTTFFGANIKTLMTFPPYNRQIRTSDDLVHSSLRLLVVEGDPNNNDPRAAAVKPALAITPNMTFMQEMRKTLNTSYCYGVTTASYNILKRQQKYFYSRPIFFVPEEFILFPMIPWGFQLQHNSPLKEPLNNLIHRVHASGLMQAWHNSLFFDLLKMKEIPKSDSKFNQNVTILHVEDLLWIWLNMTVGWALSTLVFLMELWFGRPCLRTKKATVAQRC
uniref:Uncharacterized protein n=1 Tax=Stomoxys calcitrans TaxID=35570 RepID=A0A1I8P473_STOCA